MAMAAAVERNRPYVPWSLDEVKDFLLDDELFNQLPQFDEVKDMLGWYPRYGITRKLEGFFLEQEMRKLHEQEELFGLDVGLARTRQGLAILTRPTLYP
jgi:hypothetical protein